MLGVTVPNVSKDSGRQQLPWWPLEDPTWHHEGIKGPRYGEVLVPPGTAFQGITHSYTI